MRADRLLSLMLLLQSRGRMSAPALADCLEVSERTIYRDVEALSFAGVPVYTQPGAKGGIFLDEDYRISLTGLTRPEIQALFISGVSIPVQDLGFSKTIEETLLKLFAALPSIQRRDVEQIRRRIYLDPANWWQSSQPLPQLALLQQAVWEDREICFVYRHQDGEQVDRSAEAYGLVAKASFWYFLGRVPDGTIRTYRVLRMQDIVVTESRFQRDLDFDLVDHWREACRSFEQEVSDGITPCTATLQVTPEALWYFENFMFGRYSVITPPDQGEWATIQVEFNSQSDAKSRVLAMGGNARVLAPESLSADVIQAARAIVDLNMKRD